MEYIWPGGWYIESKNLFETKLMSLFTHKVSRIFHFDYVSTWGAWSINYVFWSSINVANNTPIHEITFRVYWNSTNYQHFQLGHCLILSVIPKQSIHALTGNIHIFIASWFFFMIEVFLLTFMELIHIFFLLNMEQGVFEVVGGD